MFSASKVLAQILLVAIGYKNSDRAGKNLTDLDRGHISVAACLLGILLLVLLDRIYFELALPAYIRIYFKMKEAQAQGLL